MTDSIKINSLTANLPDAEGAQRFFVQLEEKNAIDAKKLLREKNQGLLSDVLALAAWSPFLSATILQHPEYIAWLERQRAASNVRSTEDLLESLARFSLTNSQLEPAVLLARFRRRELLRIYLQDIRSLATIAELTLELSNLADACLEYALRLARQELENRFGVPLATDEKGRATVAQLCVVGLGKLGSRELNYASDIDLLFLYSTDGATSGTGTRGTVTNREFFVKLAELTTRIIGQSVEGAAYRVDLRLRPHGRVGALAVSLIEAADYYQKTARDWERQVLLRARSAAGDPEVFKKFLAAIENVVFQTNISVAHALESVRQSKHKINQENDSTRGFNVKLGRGGIREIEFIAQALQLAYGGQDVWLRHAHTLIALSRLADREYITKSELTALSEAYAFLRTLEHRLQMENGLQTHAIPEDAAKRLLVAKRMNFSKNAEFNETLQLHLKNVSAVFERVFDNSENVRAENVREAKKIADTNSRDEEGSKTRAASAKETSNFNSFPAIKTNEKLDSQSLKRLVALIEKNETGVKLNSEKLAALDYFCDVSPYFAEMLAANPNLIETMPFSSTKLEPRSNYNQILLESVAGAANFHDELLVLRQTWTKLLFEIAAHDVFSQIEMREANRLQTELAEAGLQAALLIVQKEISRSGSTLQVSGSKTSQKSETSSSMPEIIDLKPDVSPLDLGVLSLGRLAGRGMDYGSDLDLVLVYNDGESKNDFSHLSPAEFYNRVAEILVTTLSSLTREGYLYRVDLRLRPDGRNGATVNSNNAFLNYLETRSAIWEWLAYVKLRAVSNLAWSQEIEQAARQIIHAKALQINVAELKSETARVRDLLEQQKTKNAARNQIDIKYGAGGLLDVYFAVRFLQLRDNIFDEEANRTTSFTLQKLHDSGSLSAEQFEFMREGYEFLRRLDHALRLSFGRSARLPKMGDPRLSQIARRLNFDSEIELLAALTLHRTNIRAIYEDLLR